MQGSYLGVYVYIYIVFFASSSRIPVNHDRMSMHWLHQSPVQFGTEVKEFSANSFSGSPRSLCQIGTPRGEANFQW